MVRVPRRPVPAQLRVDPRPPPPGELELLEDKDRRGGDYLPAPALLAQNRGDCDSKAVALAAVLRTYTPGRKFAVVSRGAHGDGEVALREADLQWLFGGD